MTFKNFFIWLAKTLIVLVIATLIFSIVTLDFPGLLKGMLGDIFAYSSPDAQKQAVSELAKTCSSLDNGANIAGMAQICANASMLQSMKDNCIQYKTLKEKGIQIKNEQQMQETCWLIDSGEFERKCSEIGSSSLFPDLSKIGVLCKDYESGKINDREFFFNVISGAIPSNFESANLGLLQKYNEFNNKLNKNKIIYFAILIVLIAFLYLLIMNTKLFFMALCEISFDIGILVMLPYFVIVGYEKFVGIDTTSILAGMLGTGNIFTFKAVSSVIILLFLRTYSAVIILIGSAFLFAGIAGKIYRFILLRRASSDSKPNKKKRENVENLLNELEETAKKKKPRG